MYLYSHFYSYDVEIFRYGETISKEDIWGKGGKIMAARRSLPKAGKEEVVLVGGEEGSEVSFSGTTTTTTTQRRNRGDDKRKGSTHCWNNEFVEHLKHRKTGDFLADRRVELIHALRTYYDKKRAQEEKDAKDPIPATYQYGSQKLQVSCMVYRVMYF